MFIFVLIFLFQSTIEIDKTPTKPGLYELKLEQTITNGEMGFYDRVAGTISKTGEIIVLDMGNHHVNVFDQSGQKKATFGNKGQGPGEFPNYLYDIASIHNLVIIMSRQKLILYTLSGEFVKDIKTSTSASNYVIKETDGGFRIQYSKRNYSNLNSLISEDYSLQGEKISEIKRAEYKPLTEAEMMEQDEDLAAHEKAFYEAPLGFTTYQDKYIQFRQGPFKLEFLDDQSETVKTITMSLDRFKMPKREPQVPKGNYTQERLKQIMKANQILYDAHMALTQGYKSDIVAILGDFEDNLYLLMSSDADRPNTIFVLSPDYKILDKFIIPDSEKLLYRKVRHGKLIVSDKNDDIGPFVKVYSIVKN